jgi:hypothetical protein
LHADRTEVRAVGHENDADTPGDEAPGVRPGIMKDGFNMIARDIDRAIACARLNGLQAFLWQRAREASWTAATLEAVGKVLPPPKPFALNLSECARVLGCSRRAIGQAHTDMFGMGIFYPSGGDLAKISKDFRKRWVDPSTGRPLLTAKQVRWALEAKAIKGAKRVAENSQGMPKTSVCTYEENSQGEQGCVGGKQRMHLEENSQGGRLKTAKAPIDTSAPGIGDLRETGDVGVPPTPPACEPVVDRHGEIIDVDCGVVNDPAEVNRVAEWAVDAFAGFRWGMQVRSYAKTFPIAWIELALQNAAAWPTPPRAFTPVLNELRRWHLAGGPPAIVTAPAPSAAGPAPAAPPSRLAQKLRDQQAGMDTWDF